MCSAASRPSRTAHTTSEAPRTMSPAANTPSRLVIMRRQSILSVFQPVTARSAASNMPGRSSGSKPSAFSTRSASMLTWLLAISCGVWRPEACPDGDGGVGALLRPRAAGGAGQAEMDAHRADMADTLAIRRGLAEERLRRGQPDELDAFLLGVLHLALRARHVGTIAAIQALHRLGALAHRGAHAVHRGVA